MSKFRKKPVIVEAEQFWPDKPLPFRDDGPYVGFDGKYYYVTTIHGQRALLSPGDWVIKEPRGEYLAYPCYPEFFDQNYELVESAP